MEVCVLKEIFLFLLITIIVSSNGEETDVIGPNGMQNIHQSPEDVKKFATGVCFITSDIYLDETTDPDNIRLFKVRTLEDAIINSPGFEGNLTFNSDVKFLKEPSADKPIHGTGFLVAPNLVVTAGHVINNLKRLRVEMGGVIPPGGGYDYSGLRIVFGYYTSKDVPKFEIQNPNEPDPRKRYINLPKIQCKVYKYISLKSISYPESDRSVHCSILDEEVPPAIYEDGNHSEDYAILQLGEPVSSIHSTFPIDQKSLINSMQTSSNADLFSLGFPNGLPMKYSPSKYILPNYSFALEERKFFKHTCDTWNASSGSPIFCRYKPGTNEPLCNSFYYVLGINTNGAYATITSEACRITNTVECPINQYNLVIDGNQIKYSTHPEIESNWGFKTYFDQGVASCADYKGNRAFATHFISDKNGFTAFPTNCGNRTTTISKSTWSGKLVVDVNGAGYLAAQTVLQLTIKGITLTYNLAGKTVAGGSSLSDETAIIGYDKPNSTIAVQGAANIADYFTVYWDFDGDKNNKSKISGKQITTSKSYRKAGVYRVVVERTNEQFLASDVTKRLADEKVIFSGTDVEEDEHSLVYIPSSADQRIKPLLCSTTETTQRQFYSLMGKRPFEFQNPASADYPAEKITFYDAILYCNALSRKNSLQEVYSYSGTPVYDGAGTNTIAGVHCTMLNNLCTNFDANGYRLPTVDEWNHMYWGENIKNYWEGTSSTKSDCGWFKDNANGVTHPVGLKKGNSNDLFDMAGNVYEMAYSGTAGNEQCFIKGGCFNSDLLDTYVIDKNKAYEIVGFRIVRNAKMYPTIPITCSKTTGTIPLKIQFSVDYKLLRDDNTEWIWDFGDGCVAKGAYVSHVFDRVGTWNIQVRGAKYDGVVSGETKIKACSIIPILNLLLD